MSGSLLILPNAVHTAYYILLLPVWLGFTCTNLIILIHLSSSRAIRSPLLNICLPQKLGRGVISTLGCQIGDRDRSISVKFSSQGDGGVCSQARTTMAVLVTSSPVNKVEIRYHQQAVSLSNHKLIVYDYKSLTTYNLTITACNAACMYSQHAFINTYTCEQGYTCRW